MRSAHRNANVYKMSQMDDNVFYKTTKTSEREKSICALTSVFFKLTEMSNLGLTNQRILVTTF